METLVKAISIEAVGSVSVVVILFAFIFQHLLKNNNLLKEDHERSEYRKDLIASNKELSERCDRFAAERNDLIVKHAKEVSVLEKTLAERDYQIKHLTDIINRCNCSQVEDRVYDY